MASIPTVHLTEVNNFRILTHSAHSQEPSQEPSQERQPQRQTQVQTQPQTLAQAQA